MRFTWSGSITNQRTGNDSGTSPNIRRIDVESAGEMYEAAIREFPTASAGILCAAVVGFTPETVSGHKIKREKDNLILQLKPTQDIAAALGSGKGRTNISGICFGNK